MGLDALLARLERRAADTPDTPCNPGGVSAKPAWIKACTLDTPDTPEIINGESETEKPWGWLLHFADRESLEVYSHPPVTHAEILTAYPDALATEPIPERPRREYTEQEDAEWAAAFSPPTSCITCTHTRRPGGVARYCSARPELPPAYGEGHPLRQLPDDGGVDCGQWRGWQ